MLKVRHNDNLSGFTLIELLIVIVIIGILSSITLVWINGVRIKARNVRRLSDIHQIIKITEAFYYDKGYYPIPGMFARCVGEVIDLGTVKDFGYCHSDPDYDCWISELCSVEYTTVLPRDPLPDFDYEYDAFSVGPDKPDSYVIYYKLESPVNIRPIGEGEGCWTTRRGEICGYRYVSGPVAEIFD